LPLAGGTFFQMDKTKPSYQGVFTVRVKTRSRHRFGSPFRFTSLCQ
jgi:hypothetical protein